MNTNREPMKVPQGNLRNLTVGLRQTDVAIHRRLRSNGRSLTPVSIGKSFVSIRVHSRLILYLRSSAVGALVLRSFASIRGCCYYSSVMRISRKAEYALRALLLLGRDNPDKVHQIQELS
jgi:hypothetical protein